MIKTASRDRVTVGIPTDSIDHTGGSLQDLDAFLGFDIPNAHGIVGRGSDGNMDAVWMPSERMHNADRTMFDASTMTCQRVPKIKTAIQTPDR